MDKAKLLDALKLVMPAVSKTEDAAGQDSIIFAGDWIRSFNGELSVSYPFTTEMDCSVRGPELFKVLQKIKAKDIGIKLEAGILHIDAGKTKLKLKTMEDDSQLQDRLSSLDLDKAEFVDIPEDMMEGIKLCSHAMCSNPAYAFLAGMRFTGNEILTSDNHRVGAFYMDGEYEFDFSIPRGGVMGLLKTGMTPVSVALVGAWAHFQDAEGVIYSTKLLQEKYPDDQVRAILPDAEEIESMGEVYLFPQGLEESLDRVSVLASKDDENAAQYVSVYAEGMCMVVHGIQELGEIRDVIPCESNPMEEGKVLNVAPDLLLNVLKTTREFRMGGSKVYFETDKLKYAVAVYIK